MARIIAYAHCSVQASSSDQTKTCDCQFTNTSSSGDQPTAPVDKQKEITERSDWQYILSEKFSFAQQKASGKISFSNRHDWAIPIPFCKDIFHPPC